MNSIAKFSFSRKNNPNQNIESKTSSLFVVCRIEMPLAFFVRLDFDISHLTFHQVSFGMLTVEFYIHWCNSKHTQNPDRNNDSIIFSSRSSAKAICSYDAVEAATEQRSCLQKSWQRQEVWMHHILSTVSKDLRLCHNVIE